MGMALCICLSDFVSISRVFTVTFSCRKTQKVLNLILIFVNVHLLIDNINFYLLLLGEPFSLFGVLGRLGGRCWPFWVVLGIVRA